MRTAEYYRTRIKMLQEDIELYGAAGDDLVRLAEYKRELADIEFRIKTESKGDLS